MAKSLALSIEIGLKDRATKGLQAIGGEVKKMAGGMGPMGSILTAMVPEIGQVSTRLPSERTNISGEADTRNSPSPRFISAP